MTKQNTKSSNPLGPLHTAAIKRVADVPKARQGDFNTTPGTTEKPIITAGKEPKK
jgi:hypothetical protein